MHLVCAWFKQEKDHQMLTVTPTVLFIYPCTMHLSGFFDWALLLLCDSLLSAQDNCSLQKTFDNRQCMFNKINICKTCSAAMPLRNDILSICTYSSRINLYISSSHCMHFLCSATERQHSTNTGAYMWLLGFHWGESFHRLSFVLIANFTHNHASPDKCVSHLKPNVYSPKPSLFINYKDKLMQKLTQKFSLW